MDEREFGARIKARREELGLSQQDLAVALDLDQGKISLIEKGIRRIDTVNELPKLARVLRCSIGWLFNEIKSNPARDLINTLFPETEFTDTQIEIFSGFLESMSKKFVESSTQFVKKDGDNVAA